VGARSAGGGPFHGDQAGSMDADADPRRRMAGRGSGAEVEDPSMETERGLGMTRASRTPSMESVDVDADPGRKIAGMQIQGGRTCRGRGRAGDRGVRYGDGAGAGAGIARTGAGAGRGANHGSGAMVKLVVDVYFALL
jgi:hypothetical protein